ncbi:MAG: hypothetical protein K0S32_4226 [Bacteroidetes bacterium]|jgi:hypothetical protein|nr:hypothetical protein [Bacteroidota bacterium]
MKKFLLIALAVVSVKGFSQSSIQLTHVEGSATLSANAIVVGTTTASANTKITFDIKNTSASQKSYNAIRYDKNLHTGASAYFCFAGTCYGDQTFESPTPLTLNAGQSASQLSGQYNMLIADLDEAATVGFSEIRYTFKNTADANDSVQVIIHYNQALGLNHNTSVLTSLDLFPNPATDNVSIRINSVKAVEGKLSVYNALGAVVNEKAVVLSEGKNKVDLNVESLPSGVYFASFKSGNNTTTKKFVVK